MRSLFKYLRPYKKECFLSPLFKLIEAAFELIVPLVVASLIDSGISRGDSGHIIKMGLLLILFGGAGLVFSLTAQYYAAKAATGFSAVLRSSLFETIQKMEPAEIDRVGADTLITRMTSDISQIQNGVNMFLRLLLRSPFIVAGAVIMAFTVDTGAALVFALLIPCLAIAVYIIMKYSRRGYRRIQEKLDRITGKTRENLTGVRVIRAFCMEDRENEEFLRMDREYALEQERVGHISFLMNPLTLVLVDLFTAALIYAGAIRVDLGFITRGEFVALLNYMSQILIELLKLVNLIILISKAAACGERVGELLQDREEKSGELIPFPGEGSGEPFISFDNVSLSYEGSGGRALENVSFNVKKGSVIGITGGTGSGKSSLVNLISGFYPVTEGEIRINGRDIREIDPGSLRNKVSTVFQKNILFSGTVAENLRWGDPEASDQELWDALGISQAEEFVRKKERGLSFYIEQGGKNLSGGQKQRLCIARTLVSKPEILILDDSASALDFATDLKLRTALREMENAPTLFIVSQRAASIMHSDMIIVLDDGKISGMGSHSELLKSNEVYREIYYSQFPKEGA